MANQQQENDIYRNPKLLPKHIPHISHTDLISIS